MGRFSKQGLRKVKRILIYVFSFQGAWSKSDLEKGIRSAEDEEKEKKRKALQNEKSTLEAILEEELEVDNFKGPEPVGCWESFIKGISSIWSTSDLLTGEETEERVRTVTRELGIYMVFLGILCWGKLNTML